MRGIFAQAKQSAMNHRVQGLYPPIHHFWKPGMLTHIGDRNLLLPEQAGSAARGKQRKPMFFGEGTGKGNQPTFITYREQSIF